MNNLADVLETLKRKPDLARAVESVLTIVAVARLESDNATRSEALWELVGMAYADGRVDAATTFAESLEQSFARIAAASEAERRERDAREAELRG